MKRLVCALAATLALLAGGAFASAPRRPPDQRFVYGASGGGASYSVALDSEILADAGPAPTDSRVVAYRAEIDLEFDHASYGRAFARTRRDRHGRTRYVVHRGGIDARATFVGETLVAFRLKANVRDSAGVRHRKTWRLAGTYWSVAGWPE